VQPPLDFDAFMSCIEATGALPYLVLNYDSANLVHGPNDWSYDQLLELAKSWLSYIQRMGYQARRPGSADPGERVSGRGQSSRRRRRGRAQVAHFEFSNESFQNAYNGGALAAQYAAALADWTPQLREIIPGLRCRARMRRSHAPLLLQDAAVLSGAWRAGWAPTARRAGTAWARPTRPPSMCIGGSRRAARSVAARARPRHACCRPFAQPQRGARPTRRRGAARPGGQRCQIPPACRPARRAARRAQVLGTAGEHIDFLALHSYPIYGQTYERYASSNPNMQARPPAGSAGQGAGRAPRRARPPPS